MTDNDVLAALRASEGNVFDTVKAMPAAAEDVQPPAANDPPPVEIDWPKPSDKVAADFHWLKQIDTLARQRGYEPRWLPLWWKKATGSRSGRAIDWINRTWTRDENGQRLATPVPIEGELTIEDVAQSVIWMADNPDKCPPSAFENGQNQGYALFGVIPESIGAIVVDQDDPATNPPEGEWSDHDTNPRKKPAHGHYWYRIDDDTPRGNGTWAGGETRCGAGYVVLWDPQAVAEGYFDWFDKVKPLDIGTLPGYGLRKTLAGGRVGKAEGGGLLKPRKNASTEKVKAELARLHASGMGRHDSMVTYTWALAAAPGAPESLTTTHNAVAAYVEFMAETGGRDGNDAEVFASEAKRAYDQGRAKQDAKQREGRVVVDDQGPHGFRQAFAGLGWSVAWNELAHDVEWTDSGETLDVAASTARIAGFHEQVGTMGEDNKFKPWRITEKPWRVYLYQLAHENRYNPFEQMLDDYEGAEEEGGPALEDLFIEAWGAEDTPLHREAARILMLAMVRRGERSLVYEKIDCDYIVALHGPQGAAKSKGLAMLFPDKYHSLFTSQASLFADETEWFRSVAGRVLASSDELVGNSAWALERLKTRVTRDTDTYRTLFVQNRPDTIPRRFTLAATANDKGEGFVPADASGYRRWLLVDIPKLGGAENPDASYEQVRAFMVRWRGHLWAQARRRAADPAERLLLPPEVREDQEQAATAKSYVRDSALVEWLRAGAPRPFTGQPVTEPINFNGIFWTEGVGRNEPLHPGVSSNPNTLRQALDKAGWKSERRRWKPGEAPRVLWKPPHEICTSTAQEQAGTVLDMVKRTQDS